MAIAILWVITRHCSFGTPGTLFSAIKETATITMEIFFTASGIGCWYSLEKDNAAGRFYKRRFLKLFPIYWCMVIIWALFMRCYRNTSVPVLGNLLAIEYFISPDQAYNWYISAICIVYFLAPLFKKIIDSCKNFRIKLAIFFLLTALSFVFWNNDNLLVIAYRIPSFYLGMCLASLDENYEIKKRDYIILALLFAAGAVMVYFNHQMVCYGNNPKGFAGYEYMPMAVGLCTAISIFFDLISRSDFGKKLTGRVMRFGSHTLSIFLTHLFIFMLVFWEPDTQAKYVLLWIVRILLIFPFSVLLEFLGNKLRCLIEKIIDVAGKNEN